MVDRSTAPAIDFETKVAFLSRPESYPEPTTAVEIVRTHMACVLLTDAHAWKMKKPVRHDFLDFSTLEARLHDCREELRLNRRLAPEVYLDLVPLTAQTGRLALGGGGEPVEWLVKMRRLPRDRMLDQAIRARTATGADAERVAAVLAAFYRAAAPVPMRAAEYRRRLEAGIRLNAHALAHRGYGLDPARVERVVRAELAALERDARLFERRVEAGRIVEGHGDLRPEHVCLLSQPVVIDCLEFNRDLRLLDPAEELAYLAMECEQLDGADIGEAVLAAWRELAGDAPPPRLVDFHRATRATLRARLSIWHLEDHAAGEHERWSARAARYLGLAERYCARL